MYTPSDTILERYAAVLVSFALNNGTGVRKKETVFVQLPECAKPLYVPLRNAILRAGAYPIMQFLPDDIDAAGMYSLMNDDQLDFFPAAYYKGMVEQADHQIGIIAEHNKYELAGVPPQKLLRRQRAAKPYREWRDAKENAGRFSWTLALYGTPAMAKEVGMSLKAYWEQIIAACYLDDPDPVRRWKEVQAELERVRGALNALSIRTLRVTGPDADLQVGIGPGRQWLGGSGNNIPSFELFISPDARGTEGWMRFNQPLYTHGQKVSGIELCFKEGRITRATATENEPLLKEMVATEGADRIGEFSLTDGRLSRITKFMAETLYDENMGGPEGNTHIAIGNAYKSSYPGNPAELAPEQWKELGYNESVVHTDIISTSRRTVTATLEDGSTRIIYQNGRFTL